MRHAHSSQIKRSPLTREKNLSSHSTRNIVLRVAICTALARVVFELAHNKQLTVDGWCKHSSPKSSV